MSLKRQFLIGFIIASFFLYWFLHNVDFHELLDSLKQARYLYLLPALGLIFLSYTFRALSWYYLLGGIKKIQFESLFSAIMIGFMANTLLPARVGEFVRAIVLARREGISKSTVLSTVILARILDFSFILMLFFIVVTFLPISEGTTLPSTNYTFGEMKTYVSYSMGSIFLLGVLFILGLYFQRSRALRILSLLLSPLPKHWEEKGMKIAHSFTDGLSVLQRPRQLLWAILLAGGIWLSAALAFYPLLLAFSFGVHFSVWDSFILLSAASVGVLIPTPGYVGSFHKACQIGLLLVNEKVNLSVAASFAIVSHAASFLPIVIVGLFFTFKEHLSLKEIEKEGLEEKEKA